MEFFSDTPSKLLPTNSINCRPENMILTDIPFLGAKLLFEPVCSSLTHSLAQLVTGEITFSTS